ncbi:hypothetical protein QQ045_010157 [Rhodiola kirilowii]
MRARRKHDNISLDNGDGTHTSDRNVIASQALAHFQDHLSTFSVVPSTTAFDHIQASVDAQTNDMLTALPNLEEVWNTIAAMNSSSVPGPDGFSGQFYNHCWHIIKLGLHAAITAFFSGFQLPSWITATNLILIPKKPNASCIEHL